MVRFRCAYCPQIGRARFSEVRSGVTKSHGCRKKKCFRDYCRRGVSWLGEDTLKTIFEIAELQGLQAAAAQTGVDPYLISFAWQDRCRQIADMNAGLLDAVYNTCQTSSVDHAMAIYWLSKAEVMRICRISDRAVLAAETALEAEWSEAEAFDAKSRREDHEETLLAQSIIITTSSQVKAAVSDLRSEAWWRHGIFTRKELQRNLERRSDYGWPYHHLSAMTTDQVTGCYGTDGLRFLEACDYTFQVRDRRVQEFLDQDPRDRATDSPEVGDAVRKRSPCRSYLEIPGTTPVEAAKMVVRFVSYFQNAQ
jgi:hypothetical protein